MTAPVDTIPTSPRYGSRSRFTAPAVLALALLLGGCAATIERQVPLAAERTVETDL